MPLAPSQDGCSGKIQVYDQNQSQHDTGSTPESSLKLAQHVVDPRIGQAHDQCHHAPADRIIQTDDTLVVLKLMLIVPGSHAQTVPQQQTSAQFQYRCRRRHKQHPCDKMFLAQLDRADIKDHRAKSIQDVQCTKHRDHMALPVSLLHDTEHTFNKHSGHTSCQKQPEQFAVGDIWILLYFSPLSSPGTLLPVLLLFKSSLDPQCNTDADREKRSKRTGPEDQTGRCHCGTPFPAKQKV